MAKAKTTKKGANGSKSGEKAAARVVQELARRDMKLPRSITFRTQDHGDEPVQAGDIRVTFEISDEEACAMAREKYFTRGLFIAGGRGKPDRPLIPGLAIKLETIESARVSLYLGANAGGELKLGVSKLKSPELTFDVGRKITVSTLVQATPTMGPRIGDLISRMDGGAQIAISYEHNAEQLEAFDGEEAKKSGALDKVESDVKAQVDAFNRGKPVGGVSEPGDGASSETH